MNQNTNLSDRSHSGITVDMLLALDGQPFIEQAYRTLLGRAADSDGLMHYSTMLTRSAGKLRVLADLRRSEEGGVTRRSCMAWTSASRATFARCARR